MDKIHIHGLELFAYHGVNPEEQAYGQCFVLDLTVALSLRVAGESDLLMDTLSYAQIIKAAREVFCARKDTLLECAATRVCMALLEHFPQIQEVTVLLKKPDAPIQVRFDYVAVELTRTRSDLGRGY